MHIHQSCRYSTKLLRNYLSSRDENFHERVLGKYLQPFSANNQNLQTRLREPWSAEFRPSHRLLSSKRLSPSETSRIVLFKNKTLTTGMRFSKWFSSVPTTNWTTSMRPSIITNGYTTSFIRNVKFTISWSCDSAQPKQISSVMSIIRSARKFLYISAWLL